MGFFDERRRRALAVLLIVGMLGSIVLAAGVSLAASSSPDGLERVAEDTGFAESAQDSAVAGSPLADYDLAGLDSGMSPSLAGLLGVAITAAVAFGLTWLLGRRRTATDGDGADLAGR